VQAYVQNDASQGKLGNETFYLFGNHQGEAWSRFLDEYPRLESAPLFSCANMNDKRSTLSFGCAQQHTGVPWHFHGPGFLQVLNGQKVWFLAAPSVTDEQIRFDPNVTTKDWYENVYLKDIRVQKKILICVLNAGDVIYFPDLWKHATWNTGREWNSWMSTFT